MGNAISTREVAMTITFRVDDGYDTTSPVPAVINPHQLGSLRDLLAEHASRLGTELPTPDYDDPEDGTFAFEARVCPLALASLSACFDHYDAVIAVLDEAQFRARRIRVSRDDPHGDIRLALSSNPDAAPGLNAANGNAYALLETLGLEPDSVGAVPLAELRQRLTDPRIRRRLDGDHQLTRYVSALVAMAAVKPIDGELSLAWA